MSALDFEETSSQFTSRASPVSTAIDNFTMMAWVNAEDLARGSYGSVAVCNGDNNGTTSGYSLVVAVNVAQSPDLWGFLINGIVWISGNAVLTSGAWVHLAMVRDAGTTKMYRDGVLQTATTTSAPVAPTTSFVVGDYTSSAGSNAYMDGLVALVKCWNRVLNAQEIITEMNSYYPALTNNLTAFYPLDESVGTTNRDVTQTTATNLTFAAAAPTWVAEGPPVSKGD